MAPYQPEDMNQAIVETPFGGRGLVVRTRADGIKEVRLLDWDMAMSSKRTAMLYTAQKYPSVAPTIGDPVMTSFGRGIVVELRSGADAEAGVVVVTLTNWRLAQRSRVTCYLQPQEVHVVRPKTLAEMDTYERVEQAQTMKNSASAMFVSKHYDKALTMYAEAVDAVRYVQHDSNSNNYVRADLVVVMITCCNNAGTCCIQLSKWDEAVKFSRNALVLLDALYAKRGMKLHTILNQEGIHDAQLFGEWRVKSYILTGRAWVEKHEYQQALEALKTAQDMIVQYATPPTETETKANNLKNSNHNLLTQEKEVKRLQTHCMVKRKLEKKKEKLRAQAMFGATSRGLEEEIKIPTTNNLTPPITVETPTSVDGSVARSIPAFKKKVSFKDPLSDNDDSDSPSEDEALVPWYHEHFEALVLLTGVVGGIALTFFAFSKRSRQ